MNIVKEIKLSIYEKFSGGSLGISEEIVRLLRSGSVLNTPDFYLITHTADGTTTKSTIITDSTLASMSEKKRMQIKLCMLLLTETM